MKLRYLFWSLSLFLNYACAVGPDKTPSISEEFFTVITGETTVGHLNVIKSGDSVSVDFDYKNNGRGPTMKETIMLNSKGFPIRWDITGNTTFGNSVDEHFLLQNKTAKWTDATGSGTATVDQPTLYINQFGSPYSMAIAAQVLLKEPDLSLPALPAGELQLAEMETINTNPASGKSH